jgi:hypothetical protein
VEALSKLFDEYARHARLYPAALALLPAVLFVLVAFPKSLLGEFPKNAIVVAAALALVYFFMHVARDAGKRIEPDLIGRFGGWPTTTMLRHGDPIIDSITKARYHKALSEMCPDVAWPTPQDEALNRDDADIKYNSVINLLRERRRGDEHALIHKENASYGFRRNMLGLRPLGVASASIVTLISLGLMYAQIQDAPTWSAKIARIYVEPRFAFLTLANVAVAIWWLTTVRPPWVQRAANNYARALLRSLDAPDAT